MAIFVFLVWKVPHPFPLCCLARVRRDGTLLRLSKQSTLQFVVVKPTMAILSLLALALGQYYSDSFQVCVLYHTIKYHAQ